MTRKACCGSASVDTYTRMNYLCLAGKLMHSGGKHHHAKRMGKEIRFA